MRRSNSALWVAWLLVGCAPTAKVVSVDTNRAFAVTWSPSQAGSESVPKPPSGLGAASVVLPGRQRLTIQDQSTANEGDVRRAIADQQRRDLERLIRRLSDVYENDAKRFEDEQMRLLYEQTDRAYQEAVLALREVFERYARTRGPVLAKLTIISGFPDPNPKSNPPGANATKNQKHWFEVTKRYREDLKRIDDDYDSEARALLGSVSDEALESIQAINQRVVDFRAEMDLKAQREARKQVRTTMRDLGLQLADVTEAWLPDLASDSVRVGASPPPKPAPDVPLEFARNGEKAGREEMQSELRIWGALNRYRVIEPKPGIPDKTDDFIQWRQQRSGGR